MADSILTAYKPCIKCGACDRYSSGNCKPCTRLQKSKRYASNPAPFNALSLAWRKANPDRSRENDAKWITANLDRKKITRAAWAKANPESGRAAGAAWRASNPEARRISQQNRRSRKQESGGKLSKGLAAKLFTLQNGKCPCCKQPLGDDYHLDHVMPLALGGSNTDGNMQLLRQRCNNQKHAKHPIDFMQSRGFLL